MTPILYDQVTGISSAKLLVSGRSLVSAWTIVNPGVGYSKGDVVTVAGGTFLVNTTFKVTNVGPSGHVTELKLLSAGVATSKPSNNVSTTVSPAGATGLTLSLTWVDNTAPAGVIKVLIQPETQSIRWRDDGTAPSASVGMIIPANTVYEYTGGALNALRVIETTGTAKVNVIYYGR